MSEHPDSPAREGPVTFGNVTLNAARLGEGPNLVALHGGPGLDHHLLLPLARRLAGAYRVWLPDLPGHGASIAPSGRAPGLRSIEDRLASFLGALPGGVEILLGHSMGAMIARSLVRHRRLRPRAMVLVAPPAANQPEDGSALRRAASIITAVAPVSRDPAADLRAHLDAECASLSDEALACVASSRVHPAAGYRSLLRNLHRAQRGPQRELDPGCPVLVVVGSDDRTTPPSQAERVASTTKGAKLEVIDSAGHYPFLDAPDATAERILEFLDLAIEL